MHSHFFLAEEIPLISKLSALLGMVIIYANSTAQFGSQMLGVSHNASNIMLC